jgi:[calcium/calmodulin-dependent protein kinase] kinase
MSFFKSHSDTPSTQNPTLQKTNSQKNFERQLDSVKREHRLSNTEADLKTIGVAEIHEVTSVRRNSQGEELKINGYAILKDLGSGSFATVRLVEKDKVRYAMKCFDKSILKKRRTFKMVKGKKIMSNDMDKVMDEIAIMKKLRHPNIVQLYDVIDDEEEDKLFVVMELVTCGEVTYK